MISIKSLFVSKSFRGREICLMVMEDMGTGMMNIEHQPHSYDKMWYDIGVCTMTADIRDIVVTCDIVTRFEMIVFENHGKVGF